MPANLFDYGFNESICSSKEGIGRIIRVDRGECDVISEKGKVRAVSDSNRSQGELAPVTGDWVKLVKISSIGNVIAEILPRKNNTWGGSEQRTWCWTMWNIMLAQQE